MFNTFIKVLLAMCLIAGIAYFLQDSTHTVEACAKNEGLWDEQRQLCLPRTERVIFLSISKPYPIQLTLPESQNMAVLNKVRQIEEYVYLAGAFDGKDSQPNSANKMAYLNFSDLLLMTENTQGVTYFVAPFFITGAGSGTFYYLGLFSYDFSSQKSEHLASEFIGDRVKEIQIWRHQEDELRVDYRKHRSQQSFVEYPNQPRALAFQIIGLDAKDNKAISIKSIKRMHASWDVNKDGINDCEQEGSCDHIIDYSQPRAE